MKLSDFIEQISDDFASTFTLLGPNTLGNFLSPRDFEPLTKIIHRYIPDSEISFQKTNHLGINEVYDIYLIHVKLTK